MTRRAFANSTHSNMSTAFWWAMYNAYSGQKRCYVPSDDFICMYCMGDI